MFFFPFDNLLSFSHFFFPSKNSQGWGFERKKCDATHRQGIFWQFAGLTACFLLICPVWPGAQQTCTWLTTWSHFTGSIRGSCLSNSNWLAASPFCGFGFCNGGYCALGSAGVEVKLCVFFFFYLSSCLQSAERRQAVISSLVKYLGPEAASFIHYEDKVSSSLTPGKNTKRFGLVQDLRPPPLPHFRPRKAVNESSRCCFVAVCCAFFFLLRDVLANMKQIAPDVHRYWFSCPLLST